MEVFAAIISAMSAAISTYFAMRSVDVSQQNLSYAANTTLMEHLSQINSLKITHHELWPLLEKPMTPSENIHVDNFKGLGHLIFATFKMYEEAYLMHTQKQLSDSAYKPWEDRLKADLKRWPRYAKFWDEEMEGGFKDAWDQGFVTAIKAIREKPDSNATSNPETR